MPADTAVHERQPHFVVLGVELLQRVGERFERAVHVGLHDEVQRGDLAPLDHREDVLEAGAAAEHHRVALRRDLAAVRARLGHRARHLVGGRDPQLVTGERHVVETEHLDGHRRTGLGHLLTVLVEHRADAAPRRTGHDLVADAQRAFLDERGHDRATALVEVRLEHVGLRRPLRVGDEVFGDLGVGDEQQRVEQLLDAGPGRRGDVEHDRVAAPLLGHELLLGELLAHTRGVGVFAVDLGDRDDDRHLGRAGVVDRLDRLRHDTVVGRDHEDRDVGDLRAARTHGGERLVTRRVDEGDATAVADRPGTRRCAG